MAGIWPVVDHIERVTANERRDCICNVFSHWSRLWSELQSKRVLFQAIVKASGEETKTAPDLDKLDGTKLAPIHEDSDVIEKNSNDTEGDLNIDSAVQKWKEYQRTSVDSNDTGDSPIKPVEATDVCFLLTPPEEKSPSPEHHAVTDTMSSQSLSMHDASMSSSTTEGPDTHDTSSEIDFATFTPQRTSTKRSKHGSPVAKSQCEETSAEPPIDLDGSLDNVSLPHDDEEEEVPEMQEVARKRKEVYRKFHHVLHVIRFTRMYQKRSEPGALEGSCPPEGYYDVSKCAHLIDSLNTQSCHDANFSSMMTPDDVVGHDKLCFHQWQQSWHYEDSYFCGIKFLLQQHVH